ncbi:MAG: hypothetical protein HYZ65_02745 [Burkholderiales bacterium]|nr:hypothetical protein [Burkholderiales bacterium]
MKLHKKIGMIVVLAALLPGLAGAASVRGGGSAHGFRSGFSSQKSQPAAPLRPAPTSFGSFNASRDAAPAKSGSALNRDLEKSQAQSKALKNLDARQQANSASAATSVTGRPLPPAGAVPTQTAQATPAAPAPAPVYQAPVIVQRESSSMNGAFWGFMLGNAISRPQHTTVYENRPAPLEAIAAGASVAAPVAAVAPAPVAEAAGWSLLRLLLWSLILGTIGWLLWKAWRAMLLRRQQNETQHYSLGKV